MVRFSSARNKDAYIPFGVNNEEDIEFLEQFFESKIEKERLKVYKNPYDGGGVTIQSSLEHPGEVVRAPGEPELYIDEARPAKFERAYLYNIDKNGTETLIGVFDKETKRWEPTIYGEEFIRVEIKRTKQGVFTDKGFE